MLLSSVLTLSRFCVLNEFFSVNIELSGPHPEFFGGHRYFKWLLTFFSLQLPRLAVVNKYYYVVTVFM